MEEKTLNMHELNSAWVPGKKDIIVYWVTQVTAGLFVKFVQTAVTEIYS